MVDFTIVRVLDSVLGFLLAGEISFHEWYHHVQEDETSPTMALDVIYMAHGRFGNEPCL